MSGERGDSSIPGPVVVCIVCNKSMMAAELSVAVTVAVAVAVAGAVTVTAAAAAAAAVVVDVSGD